MFDITTSIDLSKLEPLNKEGKNSSVYSYYDQQLGKDLIVKVISNETAYKQYGSEYINNLFAESKILYSNKHPNIVEIQYASYDKDNVYISMPKYKNGSLNALIDSKFLTVREILKFSLEFLSGLHYVHTNDLIHFDIKPTNILIDDNGKAVLTDFGIAKYIDTDGTASPNIIYSTHKPPEYFKNERLTNKSDIFQAGITLYRLCNGNDIFHNQFTKSANNCVNDMINGKLPDRKFYLPHIPPKLQKIINKSISVDPDDRYDTVLEMINQLSSVGENLDWRLDNLNNEFVWSRLNDNRTHDDCIILSENGHNKYDVKKVKKNLLNSKSINSDIQNSKNLELTEAHKLVAGIFKM